MKYYECWNYDGWTCPESCVNCDDEDLELTDEGELIKKFLDDIDSVIADVVFDMRNSQRLAEDLNDEPKYYEGHWIGMDAVRVDFLLPLKEKWEKELKS